MSKFTKEERDLAELGLIALIDEATGYQKERFKDKKALAKELKKIKDRNNSWEKN